MHWWENILYYPEGQLNVNHDFYRRVNALPEQSIWQFMELFNGTLGQHNFCVCHPARPTSSYQINFGTGAFMDYVPFLRCREVAPKADVPAGCIAVERKPRPAYTLSAPASALFRQIDGTKSVRECFAASGLDSKDPESICRATFQYLWRLSYIFLRVPS